MWMWNGCEMLVELFVTVYSWTLFNSTDTPTSPLNCLPLLVWTAAGDFGGAPLVNSCGTVPNPIVCVPPAFTSSSVMSRRSVGKVLAGDASGNGMFTGSPATLTVAKLILNGPRAGGAAGFRSLGSTVLWT